MRVLVINLRRSTDRLEFQEQQMHRLSLAFERLPAVESRDLNSDETDQLSREWERPMRPNEMACLRSHQKAWAMIAESDVPALVLEDDALLASTTPAVLRTLEQRMEFDHVTLETRGRKKILARRSQQLTEQTRVTRLYQDRSGAAAYVLWPDGASRLLARSHRSPGLADAVIAAAYYLRSYQVEPAPAIQLDQCERYELLGYPVTQTNIGTSDDPKPAPRNGIESMRFRRRRIAAQFRMGLRQLSLIGRATRRYADVNPDDFPEGFSPSSPA